MRKDTITKILQKQELLHSVFRLKGVQSIWSSQHFVSLLSMYVTNCLAFVFIHVFSFFFFFFFSSSFSLCYVAFHVNSFMSEHYALLFLTIIVVSLGLGVIHSIMMKHTDSQVSSQLVIVKICYISLLILTAT